MRWIKTAARHAVSVFVGALMGFGVLVALDDQRRAPLIAAWQTNGGYAVADMGRPYLAPEVRAAPPRLAKACRAFKTMTHAEAQTGHISASRRVALYCADIAASLDKAPQEHAAGIAARRLVDALVVAHDRVVTTRAALRAAGRSDHLHYVAREAILRDAGVVAAARTWARTYRDFLNSSATG